MNKKIDWLRLVARIMLTVLLSTLVTCSSTDRGAQATITTAPEFTANTLSGDKVSLGDFKGKVVILDFWATWCPPCRKEIPHFKSLYSEYADKGVVILGVAVDDQDKVKAMVKRETIPYPIVIADKELVSNYNIQYFPTTFLIDKQGKIHQKWVGYRGKAVFERAIKKLM